MVWGRAPDSDNQSVGFGAKRCERKLESDLRVHHGSQTRLYPAPRTIDSPGH
jgi:hypothetical protein